MLLNRHCCLAEIKEFFISFEGAERDALIGKIHGEEAVNNLRSLGFIEELSLYAGIAQLVGDLADFHKEITPLLAVVAEQTAFLALLGDCQVCERVCIAASLEIQIGRAHV